MPNPFPSRPDHLFRNDGGRFVDVTAEAGIVDPNGRGLGVVAADVDDDGLIDLFVANDTTANYLWHNLGGMKFEEAGVSSGVACNAQGAFQAGMGTAVGDLDGDGLPDLTVTNFYGESTSFFKNMGKGMFADRTSAIGLAAPSRYLVGFGIVLFDANNDGRLDLAQTNGHVVDNRPDFPLEMPGLLLIGGDHGRLVDVTAKAGPAWSVPRIGRALAAGDLDNDGRIDLVSVPQNTPLVFFHNQTASAAGHAVTFLLEGTRSNRDGVGAVVTVTAGGRRRRAWRYGGGSYQSASDPRLHFGLGQDRIDEVEVRWPSGQVDRFENLEVDRCYRLREGDANPTLLWSGAANVPRRAPSRTAAKFEQVRAAGNDDAAFELGEGGRREFKRNRQCRRESCHSGTPNAEPLAHDQYDRKLNRARRWVLLAGLLAGLSSFGIGEALYDLIPAKKVKLPVSSVPTRWTPRRRR